LAKAGHRSDTGGKICRNVSKRELTLLRY